MPGKTSFKLSYICFFKKSQNIILDINTQYKKEKNS